MHLLWNNPTIRNAKSSTQIQDHMLSGSVQTLNQQAKQFNVIPTQLHGTLQNPLSSIPPLLHLATLHTDSIDTKVNYFNIEFENLGGNHDFVEGFPDTVVVDHISQAQETIVVESYPFKRGTKKSPPGIAFQVHLLSQLQAHQRNDLNMFNQIVECVKKHAVYHRVNFATLAIMSRQQLLIELSKYYNLKFMQPTLHHVPLAGGSVATFPIFNVKSLLHSFF